MADDGVDMAPPSTRPMNFVSDKTLAEARRSRGARVDDGTAQRDRSLYEILEENRDRRDAEFNERFKHRPPKALDDDETEFLEKLETSKGEYKRRMADEEAQQLQIELLGRKNPPSRPWGVIIKAKLQAKKAKIDMGSLDAVKSPSVDTQKNLDSVKSANGDADEPHVVANTGFVSYSDDSDED
ncbi:hypothetical protein RHSIM_Rhsim01G0085900 [Rhododendron simsii]|uniref:FAM192A/Fyv6 N-terminal domain-containing protein n=1 Tax=Rhododendron simsii TaxID=118357 RepID=A0A834LVR7_RHOSS|nr:hypothetical protein RHSIM_Rhsim01G0085900 [Rhododendron simsii]